VHELSVCQALLTQIEEIARKEQAEAVSSITIELGPLCGVEPSLLRAAFTAMQSPGIAAGADLIIETPAISVDCVACGVRSNTVANRLVCGSCGGYRTRIVAGAELRLLRVAMHVTRPMRAAAETMSAGETMGAAGCMVTTDPIFLGSYD
jgi:hydrogenase nickel incorporation protein HypA/HybF